MTAVNNENKLNMSAIVQNITDNFDVMSNYFSEIDRAMNIMLRDIAVYERWESINKTDYEPYELRINEYDKYNGIQAEAYYMGYATGENTENKLIATESMSEGTGADTGNETLAFVPVIEQINAIERGAQNIADEISQANGEAESRVPYIREVISLEPVKGESASLTPVWNTVSNIETVYYNSAYDLKNPVSTLNQSEYSFENAVGIQEIMKNNNADRNTAVQLLNYRNSYQEVLSESEKNYDKLFEGNDNIWLMDIVKQEAENNVYDTRKHMIENMPEFSELGKTGEAYNTNQEAMFNTWKAQNQSVSDTYRQNVNAKNLIQNISTDINDYLPGDFELSDYMGNYDLSKYTESANYSDVISVANETAENTKEIAKNTEKTSDLIEMVKDNWEKKLLKEYTSKANVITYDLSGMQNTYNNPGQNFDPVKEVERYLKKKAAISTEGI